MSDQPNPKWQAKVWYDDGGISSNWFMFQAAAEAWVQEECRWEGTHHAVVKGPQHECFYQGDFR